MGLFERFANTPYTFLEISGGTISGNMVVSERELSGVFKLRDSENQQNSIENRLSTATLHVKQSDFADGFKFVGHGVRVSCVDYRIVSATEGKNFRTGEISHYTLTLQKASFVYAGKN